MFLTLMTDQATRFVETKTPRLAASLALSMQAPDPAARGREG